MNDGVEGQQANESRPDPDIPIVYSDDEARNDETDHLHRSSTPAASPPLQRLLGRVLNLGMCVISQDHQQKCIPLVSVYKSLHHQNRKQVQPFQ